MTSFSFILGVVPLALASGAGYELRRALGTAVFSGMLGVTFFGLLLTPVFYVVIRRFTTRHQDAGRSQGEDTPGAGYCGLTWGSIFISVELR